MGHHFLPGNPPVELILRRSTRSRRISLRVSSLDGRVTLTMPPGIPEREALEFARQKEDWLRSHLAKRKEDVAIGFGAVLPIAGELKEIVPSPDRKVHLCDETIAVPGPADRVAARLSAWIKQTARDRLVMASDTFAAQVGRRYSRISVRDTRSRWGSCSEAGALMYSWRLLLAPPDALDYVAAHEVAHLVEMNHSPDFWSVVRSLKPNYEEPRAWMREHGSALHRYRFKD
jgi:predicted metal-dependent hydrolase